MHGELLEDGIIYPLDMTEVIRISDSLITTIIAILVSIYCVRSVS